MSKLLDFLTELYGCGLGFLDIARLILALQGVPCQQFSITLLDAGNHGNWFTLFDPKVIKAAFPRYQTTWDTSVVPNFLKEWHPVNIFFPSAPHLHVTYVMRPYNRSKVPILSLYELIVNVEI